MQPLAPTHARDLLALSPACACSAALLWAEPAGGDGLAAPPLDLLRGHLLAVTSPTLTTVVDRRHGGVVMQSPESCACLGIHAPMPPGELAAGHALSPVAEPQRPPTSLGSRYLAELFHGQEVRVCAAPLAACKGGATVAASREERGGWSVVHVQEQLEALHVAMREPGQQVFEGRVQVRSPLLRSWMGLQPGEELWYQLHVAPLRDPLTQQDLLVITQVSGRCCRGGAPLCGFTHALADAALKDPRARTDGRKCDRHQWRWR